MPITFGALAAGQRLESAQIFQHVGKDPVLIRRIRIRGETFGRRREFHQIGFPIASELAQFIRLFDEPGDTSLSAGRISPLQLPDLAGAAVAQVAAPTLLIVGGDDQRVLELNRQVFEQLRSEKRLEIVPGASNLFEEPGTLGAVTDLTGSWFCQHLAREESRP